MSFAELLLKRMREQQSVPRKTSELPTSISPPVPQHPQDEMMEAVRKWKAQQGERGSRIVSREEYQKIKGEGK